MWPNEFHLKKQMENNKKNSCVKSADFTITKCREELLTFPFLVDFLKLRFNQ